MKKATFAAGCFWGVEKIFLKLPGVISTQVGYAGGSVKNPDYEQVCSGSTGHAEALEVTYDPKIILYEELLAVFWEYHDPTTKNQQGPDIGSQYRSAIFYYDEEQKKLAEKSRELLDVSGVYKNKIVTEIVPAAPFFSAEEYHQRYLEKNPFGYCSHRLQSKKIREALKPLLPQAEHR